MIAMRRTGSETDQARGRWLGLEAVLMAGTGSGATGPGASVTDGDATLAGTKPRVLIVEDEAIIAWELSDTVERLGYDVCGTAASAAAAIDLDARLQPDVILMDVRLGRGGDGISAAEAILVRRQPAIIFCTAYANDPAIAARLQSIDPVAVLAKPVQYTAVAHALREALERKPAQ